MTQFSLFTSIFFVYQLLFAVSAEDKYEPMVAFICDRPAMHRSVSGWIADKSTDCLTKMEDILAYCKTMYPEQNITNVVESSSLVTIPDWPMVSADRKHPHRVRPFRCLVGGFQSDALLVPQHCEFDHRHDQSLCEGFSYWNIVADEACKKKLTHLESFGMLLNCALGKFSGVEYVCCPNKTETNYHPPQDADRPDKWHNSAEDDDYVEDNADDDDDDDDDSSSEDDDDEDDDNAIDLYKAYKSGQEFPHKYNNEHKKFLAAKDRMKKNQQLKITKLLQEWQAAREHVNEVRKTDTKTANDMAKEITERFQNLYAAYEQEDEAEKEQLIALHLQHVQTGLNDKKKEAMDKYLKALDQGDASDISKYLRGYIKAEEKDRLHTVNHFEHVKYSAPSEAAHIRPFIVNHLHLSEQRIDQALEMLKRDPQIETKVRPEIDEFMRRFDVIANSIRDIILSDPKINQQVDSTSQQPETSSSISIDTVNSSDESMDENSNDELDPISQDVDLDDDEDTVENEHDYERKNNFVAHHMHDTHHVKQGFAGSAASGSHVGSTVGIVLGSFVGIFVIIAVAIVMLRRSKSKQTISHGYVEVDPSASPEDRHVVNMQMNGYENPTYKYFEVQSNPKA